MITDVPTSRNFAEHGLMFLNLAWDAVLDLLLQFTFIERQVEGFSRIDIGVQEHLNEESSRYWDAAKNPLSIAHALAQQGAELVLKSKIAEVSPFLLLSDWPRCCGKQKASFADFRTIDAGDLIRACRAVHPNPIDDEFENRFEQFRKQRNALFHTVDKRLKFPEIEVVLYILIAAQQICPGGWRDLRYKHIEREPAFSAYGEDDISTSLASLCHEMDVITKILGTKDLQRFFSFDKKRHHCICPNCWWECNREVQQLEARTAILKPNTPKSQTLFCFVCDSIIPVTRKKCSETSCKGNVIHDDSDYECLTCFAEKDT